MVPFIKNVHDVAAYSKLLRLFYGYYKPLQDAVDEHINVAVVPDYGRLRKAEWILDDLKTLGQPVNNLPLYHPAFSIQSNAAALGALYVTEGSTLGGKVICKMIATNLGKTNMEGFKFFNGYGNETGGHWKKFLQVLDIYSDTDDEAVIIESANEVFAGFKSWMNLTT
jgi:heme oxygenase